MANYVYSSTPYVSEQNFLILKVKFACLQRKPALFSTSTSIQLNNKLYKPTKTE